MANKKSSKSPASPDSSAGQMLIYQDAGLNLQVRLDGDTVWLSRIQIAELFQTTPQNITLHVAAIYDEGELDPGATSKDYLLVQSEGGRQVRRSLKHYSSASGPPPGSANCWSKASPSTTSASKRAALSGRITSTNFWRGFATSAPASGSSTRRSPTFTPPASTTTATPS